MSASSSPRSTRRIQRAAGLRGAQWLRNAIVFAQAIEMAKTTEPKALIKALETGSFKGWSARPGHLPAGRRRAVAQLVAAADDPANTPRPRSDAGGRRGRLYVGRQVTLSLPRAESEEGERERVTRAVSEREPGAVMFSAELLTQTLISGLMIGVLYALMALGITFIYSIVRMINWAMGEFYMLGSYIQYVVVAYALGPRLLVARRHHLDRRHVPDRLSARADPDQADARARRWSGATITPPS